MSSGVWATNSLASTSIQADAISRRKAVCRAAQCSRPSRGIKRVLVFPGMGTRVKQIMAFFIGWFLIKLVSHGSKGSAPERVLVSRAYPESWSVYVWCSRYRLCAVVRHKRHSRYTLCGIERAAYDKRMRQSPALSFRRSHPIHNTGFL